ncbi:MAG: DUF1611 domain-containing protein [Candidatus Thermoplasmatota archaeon]|nr:DUF1611 domain-containing protein [Candidatus Thermoplasmatota archaeon]MBU1940658.1 DUF1611 domain-containing protein [Candidatus Thermoplasmatota archaeon]
MKKNNALVYADGRYTCADGKTAHGLVRYSKKFHISSVVDTTIAEGDAGVILDGTPRDIPLYNNLDRALNRSKVDTFIIGAVSEGGMLPEGYNTAVQWALNHGLNIVSGLHQFLSDDKLYKKLANKNGCTITDARKLFRDYKRFYTGEITSVEAIRIAILGTDSAIGKRTIAVMLNETIKAFQHSCDMIYTGQTGWMQGWPHGIILDAMINDFISGGIEGAILQSWKDDHPDFMLIEGQGSIVHPFFPGGFEILAAGKIHGFIVVDAPKRPHLDGFSGYPMPDVSRVIKIAELLTEKPLLGIGLNRENMDPTDITKFKEIYTECFDVPVVEPISEGVEPIVKKILRDYVH